MQHNLTTDEIWLGIGFFGQAMFFGRFFVQWIATERAQKSVIPTMFWYFSIAGGLILLVYSIYRKDPVFIAGQGLGLLIYLRNLHFVLRADAADKTTTT
ncbi:MAG TPA: lipid-A-disaccharide synthase N-terminal domain-containing protein [Alphaproteobacteria bacterium]